MCKSEREGDIKEKGEKDEGKGRRVRGDRGRSSQPAGIVLFQMEENSLSTVKKNAPDEYLIHQRTPDVLIN